jgi:hypothetical protein
MLLDQLFTHDPSVMKPSKIGRLWGEITDCRKKAKSA